MVHSGSVIASSISQGHTNVCGINTRSVDCYHAIQTVYM
jgi:hypothetical protein